MHGNRQLVNSIFETFSMDFAGPLPQAKTSARDVIVAVKILTRWVIAKEIETQTAEAAYFSSKKRK